MSSYQVLARRWRPQTFLDLIGQDHVATTLLNAMKLDRMPHALLFTGARGVGKTSAARILAKSLRCPNAQDFNPCGKCPDCEDIALGRSVDVIEIDGASNNSVDNIRDLRETVGYMPATGKYKIYIIDEVHMLSTSAFNALLKTLEEPPAHVIFIFATTEVQKIPVTVLSRCQRFDFRRIPIRKVVERLQTIIAAEGVVAESEALWIIARESEGSMRDSQSLLDQVMSFCGKNITYAQVVEVLGLTDRTLLSDILKALLDHDSGQCLKIIEKTFHLGCDPVKLAQELLEQIRNLMVVKVSSEQNVSVDFLDLPDQELTELGKVAMNLSSEDIHLLFDMTLKGVSEVSRAQNPQLVLEMLLIRLSQAPRLASIESFLKDSSEPTGEAPRPQSPQAIARPQTKPSAAPTPSFPVKKTSETLAEKDWPQVIERIKRHKPLLAAKLEYAAAESFDDARLVLAFNKEQEFIYTQVASSETKTQLSQLLTQIMGRPYTVDVKITTEPATSLADKPLSPVAAKEMQKRVHNEEIRKKVDEHPLVQEVKKVFQSEVVTIKELT